MAEEQRVQITTSCRDTDYIPKVDNAGSVFDGPDGRKVQVMHNGLKVSADSYYGPFVTRIIEGLGGHHEPQEEKLFFEVLKKIPAGSTMIELGAYWSYYSLWFNKEVVDAKNYMVEPETENLETGKFNFELNNSVGTFEHALVSDVADDSTSPPSVSVDHIIEKYGLDDIAILHSDIQGFERLMLDGAKNVLGRKGVRFIFISTHGYEIHQRCMSFLNRADYHLVASHTPSESFSGDGLIVASAEPEFDKLPAISYRRKGLPLRERVRGSLYRLGVYRALSTVFSKGYPGPINRVLR